MILYLSSTAHTNLLDFWSQREDGGQIPVKKMVGDFMLKQFVVYDMRNFSHVSEVVLDRIAFGDTDEAFAEAIEEFLTMYQARVTVICEGLDQSEPLFQALLDCGVGNLVCGVEIEEIQQEIRECLSRDGMQRYGVKRKDFAGGEAERYRFVCEDVKVAVISSQPRMGATTVAVGLCTWLAQVGATVSYVEANGSGHLNLLARSYEMEENGQGYLFEEVFYQVDEGQGGVNFVVYDIGTAVAEKRRVIEQADVVLLVCGTKPYELPFTLQLQRQMAGREYDLVLPFVAEEIRAEIETALGNGEGRVLFMEAQAELTSGKLNAQCFRTVVGDYIAGME